MAHQDAGNDFSLFVGDIAEDVDDMHLTTTFQTYYPSVKNAKVMFDPSTQRTRGYGFVRFTNEAERDRAISEMNGVYISSRPIRVSVATAKKPPGPGGHMGMGMGGSGSGGGASHASSQGALGSTHASAMGGGGGERGMGGGGGGYGSGDADTQNTTLFIGGLSPGVTEHDLHVAFSRYGELVYTKIPMGKGCGFVQFVTRPAAEHALQELNGYIMAGQSIRLSWGRSQGKPPPVGGGGGGGHGPHGGGMGGGHHHHYMPPPGAGGGGGYAYAGQGYDQSGYGGYAYGGGGYGDPYAAGYGYGMDPYAAAAYGYGMVPGQAQGYPPTPAHMAAANAAAAAHGGGMHGSGPMPHMQPMMYDPLAPVNVDKMNMAWMHRHVPMMTGAWVRPMPVAILPHHHIPASTS